MSEHSKDKTSKEALSLLRRMQRLEERTNNPSSSVKKGEAEISLPEISRNLGLLAGTIGQIKEGAHWVYLKVIVPLASLFPFLKNLWGAFKSFCLWFCHPVEPLHRSLFRLLRRWVSRLSCWCLSVFGKRTSFCDSADKRPLRQGSFSKPRAGILTLCVIIFLAWPLRIPFLRDISFALCYELPYDLTRMSLNLVLHGGQFAVEKLYLNGKNEIDHHNNIWSVSGCQNESDCIPADAVYFRIKPSIAHMLWSLTTKQQLFISDDIAGVIPNVPSTCEVKSYGVRLRILRWMQSYPVMLDVHCEALS